MAVVRMFMLIFAATCTVGLLEKEVSQWSLQPGSSVVETVEQV